MPDRTPAPRAGEAFVLPEDDYRYGVGPIVAHVKQVIGRVPYHDEQWWVVVAEVAEGTANNPGLWREQELYIREASFPRTRQVPKV